MIRPVGHRILVQSDIVETKTKSGLVLALDEKLEVGAKVTGTVLAIGPTAYKHPDLGGDPWCKVGDRVYWAKYAGKRVVDPDDPDTETSKKVLICLNDEDVVAVIA